MPLGAHIAAALLVADWHRRKTQLLGAPLARLDACPAARVAALEPGLADGRAALHDGDDRVGEDGARGFRAGGGGRVQREGVDGRANLLRAHHARLDTDATGRIAARQARRADRSAALDHAGDGARERREDGHAPGLAVDDGAGGCAGAFDCCAGGDGGGGGVEVDGRAVDHAEAAGQDGQQESPGGFGEAGHGEGVRMNGCLQDSLQRETKVCLEGLACC